MGEFQKAHIHVVCKGAFFMKLRTAQKHDILQGLLLHSRSWKTLFSSSVHGPSKKRMSLFFRKEMSSDPSSVKDEVFTCPQGASGLFSRRVASLKAAMEYFSFLQTQRILQKNQSFEVSVKYACRKIVRICLNFKKFEKSMIFALFLRVSASKGKHSPLASHTQGFPV